MLTSWKIWKSMGRIIPYIMGKNVPNHQPVIQSTINPSYWRCIRTSLSFAGPTERMLSTIFSGPVFGFPTNRDMPQKGLPPWVFQNVGWATGNIGMQFVTTHVSKIGFLREKNRCVRKLGIQMYTPKWRSFWGKTMIVQWVQGYTHVLLGSNPKILDTIPKA